jgi:putative transposase
MDIPYIPMARGFVHLTAVVDWFSRRVLAWRLSITMEVDFCLDAVEEALAKYGRPDICNTDQGSHFTSAASPACCWRRSPSAWTAAALGETTSLSNGSSGRSNTRTSTCGPTPMSLRHAPRLAGI